MTQLLKGVRETITVPIPKGRTYFSPKQRNGYKNQIICTDDLDCEQIVGEFAGYSIEFAYSKGFLKYVMTPMESDKFGIIFKGIDGVTNFSGEIYRICQFLKQDEMITVIMLAMWKMRGSILLFCILRRLIRRCLGRMALMVWGLLSTCLFLIVFPITTLWSLLLRASFWESKDIAWTKKNFKWGSSLLCERYFI